MFRLSYVKFLYMRAVYKPLTKAALYSAAALALLYLALTAVAS